jgi:hypothetical protein
MYNNKNIITTADSLQFPEGIKTSHLSLAIGSHNHKVAHWVATEALSIFHDFAMKKNLLYTIQGGSLIGHYWNRKIIHWDDDIDIHAEEQCQQDIALIWKKGEPLTRDFFPEVWRGKGQLFETSRKVYFSDRACLLCFQGGAKTSEGCKPIKGLKQKMLRINWKLIPLNEHEELYTFNRGWKCDEGKQIPTHLWAGMDINIPQKYGGKILDSWFIRKEVPWFRRFEDERDFPVTQFNGVDARVVSHLRGGPWLDKMYGAFWREKKHEKLKTKKDKCVDFRFKKK